MISIEIHSNYSIIRGIQHGHFVRIVSNLSVKPNGLNFILKNHFSNVHPWTCRSCDYREPRKGNDHQATKICPKCNGEMYWKRSWCMYCNGFNFITPVKYKIKTDGSYELRVPTGLIARAIQVLKTCVDKSQLKIVNKIAPPSPSPIPIDIELRDYQEEVARAYKKSYRGCWQVPTGGGKTVLAISAWAYWGKPGLIIVPTEEIQEQFYNSAIKLLGDEYKDKIGLVGGCAERIKGDSWSPGFLTIALFQILAMDNREEQSKELLNSVDFIAADEGHHLPAESLYDAMQQSNARIRYAFSATLEHNDLGTLFIEAATGPMIAIIYDRELISEGWKATPIVRITEFYCTNYGTYRKSLDRNVYKNFGLTVEILEIVKQHASYGEFVLITTDKKEHMRQIFLYLRNEGINVDMVSGDTPDKERSNTVKSIRDGTLNAVVATQVFDEGLDIPDANAIILAQGGKSQIKHKQRIGRVLRPKPGENVAYVYDFIFNDRSYLSNHSRTRVNRYREWDWKIEYRDRAVSDIDAQMAGVYAFTKEEKSWIKTGKGNIDSANTN